MIPNLAKEYLCDGSIDLDTHTFKVMLLDNTYTPSADHDLLAEVSGDEISGAGYDAGGKTLSGISWAASGGTATLDATDAQWTSATFTARYAVIYDDTQTSPLKPILRIIDFGSDQSVNNGTFTIQWNASGILTLN